MKYLIFSIILFLLTGCANIVPLTGGKKDEKKPILLKSNLVTTNFKADHIKLEFDEYITTADGIDLITIQPKHSTFTVNGNDKTIRINLDSALKPNTTYNLNITNGIKDLNEDNNFSLSYIFSTGPQIDTNFVNYKILNYKNYKNLKIGLNTEIIDSVQKLKFDYFYPINEESIFIRGLGQTNYKCWIFTDENNDNIPDEYRPIYYDTIELNTTKTIILNNWFNSNNSKNQKYDKFTKIYKMINDLKTYHLENVIYLDKDSSLFYSNYNDSLPVLELSQELNKKITFNISAIKSNKEFLLNIDKCGIKNIKITDKLNFREDDNYFYVTSKIKLDSINFKVSIPQDTIYFYSKINKYDELAKISTLKITKNEKYGEVIIMLYQDDNLLINKKINLKVDQIFYLNPGTYKLIIYNTDSFENISFNLTTLKRSNCKIIENEIILKPNWDEVLQVIF